METQYDAHQIPSEASPAMKNSNAPALAFVLAVGLLASSAIAEDLTPSKLAKRLAAKPTGDDAKTLADDLTRWFGKNNLPKGPGPKSDALEFAWAIEAPGASKPPEVVSEDGKFELILTRVGDTNLYAGSVPLPEGAAMRWAYKVDQKLLDHPTAKNQRAEKWSQLEAYTDQPDLAERSDVPKGKVTQQPKWKSKVFPDTSRDWWVYVPAQYTPETAAAVMVFQDGGGTKGFVPTVFDNLIAKKEMPITVGIFINPGAFDDGRSNRSFEYDTLSDQYARMLLEEILPEVEKTVKLRHDAAGRAIQGASSGGICAFTVAWERPTEFSKVVSWIGSFTNIASGKTGREGGHNYEAMIRKTPKKPLRVFLQDGSSDLDNPNGNWPLANQTLAKSLAFKDYDYKFVYGQGFHSGKHGRAILPDTLRWLWRGWESELPK